jgi:hypothetical protein
MEKLIKALNRCAEVCDACAKSCLDEKQFVRMQHCILQTAACRYVCLYISDRLKVDPDDAAGYLIFGQKVCDACAHECSKYPHPHCVRCAQECARCAAICLQPFSIR